MKITFFFTHQNHTTNFYSLLYYYSIFSINTSIYITIYILFIDFYSVEIYLYYSSITKQNFCFCFDQSSTATLFFTISVGSSIFSSGFLAKKKLLFHSFFFFCYDPFLFQHVLNGRKASDSHCLTSLQKLY